MRFTVNEMYDILINYCGVSEEFISGAVAIGGFTKETMDNVAYYKAGYQTVEDWFDYIADEEEVWEYE